MKALSQLLAVLQTPNPQRVAPYGNCQGSKEFLHSRANPHPWMLRPVIDLMGKGGVYKGQALLAPDESTLKYHLSFRAPSGVSWSLHQGCVTARIPSLNLASFLSFL